MSWALIGQLGTGVATVLAAIKLWKILTEKRHRVTMSVQVTHNPVPPFSCYLDGVIGKSLPHSIFMASQGILDQLTSSDGLKFRDKRDEFASALLQRIPQDAGRDEATRLIRVTLEN